MFLSLGHLVEIKIPVQFCRKCRRIFYPELFKYGVFPIHNRFLLTLDFLLDVKNTLVQGSSAIEAIKQKICLLSMCEGLSGQLETNLSNRCKNIETACVAVLALLITPADMDRVTCLICGVCPKIVNSDGNAKDTLTITENMIFDYEDESNIPDLESFKIDLVLELLKRSYFQKVPRKTYNMLKLPLIIAPGLLREQVNNDIKETIVYLSKQQQTWYTSFFEIVSLIFTEKPRIP